MSERITYVIATLIISLSFGFSGMILTTPPSLGYLAILYSSIFGLLMTILWSYSFWKSKFGKSILIINSVIGILTIWYLTHESNDYEAVQRNLGIVGNLLTALSTLILGTLHFVKVIKNNL